MVNFPKTTLKNPPLVASTHGYCDVKICQKNTLIHTSYDCQRSEGKKNPSTQRYSSTTMTKLVDITLVNKMPTNVKKYYI
jgi:hypothetical protein